MTVPVDRVTSRWGATAPGDRGGAARISGQGAVSSGPRPLPGAIQEPPGTNPELHLGF